MSHTVTELDALGRPRKQRATPERDFQRAAVRWLRTVLPGAIVAAVPNEQRGAGRTYEQRMRFGAARKASGVLSGFPDVTVWPVGQEPFLVECKAPGGVVSDSQREMHLRLRTAGYVVVVADALESLRHELLQAGICTIEASGQPARPAKVSGL